MSIYQQIEARRRKLVIGLVASVLALLVAGVGQALWSKHEVRATCRQVVVETAMEHAFMPSQAFVDGHCP